MSAHKNLCELGHLYEFLRSQRPTGSLHPAVTSPCDTNCASTRSDAEVELSYVNHFEESAFLKRVMSYIFIVGARKNMSKFSILLLQYHLGLNSQRETIKS